MFHFSFLGGGGFSPQGFLYYSFTHSFFPTAPCLSQMSFTLPSFQHLLDLHGAAFTSWLLLKTQLEHAYNGPG